MQRKKGKQERKEEKERNEGRKEGREKERKIKIPDEYQVYPLENMHFFLSTPYNSYKSLDTPFSMSPSVVQGIITFIPINSLFVKSSFKKYLMKTLRCKQRKLKIIHI